VTNKQKKFCLEYMVDLNATQAAIRTGYSENTAYAIGAENLRKPQIALEIEKLRKEMEERTGITVERVLREYGRLAFFDPRKLFDDKGNLIPIHQLDADTAAAISGIDVNEIMKLGSEEEILKTINKKIKHIDKKGALDSIGKYLGMLIDRSKIEVEGKIATGIMSDSDLEKIVLEK